MTVSSSNKKPVLQRSIPYGAPYAYEKLAEAKKNQSIQESSILDGSVSLSSILLSFDNNCSAPSSDDDSYSYSYDAESDEDDGGRLGATPSKKRGGCLSKKRGRFPSISPVKSSEDNATLDIPGMSDWSVDISRMSVPALMIDRGDEEAIAQDANTTPYEVADDASREDSPNESTHNDAEMSITLREQLESLGLRLDSLEKAIFSDDLNGTSDVNVGDQNQNMAFIVEEDDSTVEPEVVLSEAEESDNDSVRNARRSKQSFFVRFFFFGGCRKQ